MLMNLLNVCTADHQNNGEILDDNKETKLCYFDSSQSDTSLLVQIW